MKIATEKWNIKFTNKETGEKHWFNYNGFKTKTAATEIAIKAVEVYGKDYDLEVCKYENLN